MSRRTFELSDIDSIAQVSVPEDGGDSRRGNADELCSELGSEEIVQVSRTELTQLIKRVEDVLVAIEDRWGNRERPRTMRRNTWFMKLWAWIVKYFLATTFLWQVACIGLLSIIEAIHQANQNPLSHSLIVSTIILTFCQVVLIFVVICMSIKITKQYLHMTLTPWFLAQAYFSSILVFTGLYTLYIRISKHSFKHINEPDTDAFAFEVYVHMMFFSVSTATLCGISTTFPNVWYAYITVSIQMVLSFVYFASILSIAINRPRRKRTETVNEQTALLSSYGTAENQSVLNIQR